MISGVLISNATGFRYLIVSVERGIESLGFENNNKYANVQRVK
jgi:hypothetical protein